MPVSGPAFFSLSLFRGERFSVEVHQIVGAGTAAGSGRARPRRVFVINIGPEGTTSPWRDHTPQTQTVFGLIVCLAHGPERDIKAYLRVVASMEAREAGSFRSDI